VGSQLPDRVWIRTLQSPSKTLDDRSLSARDLAAGALANEWLACDRAVRLSVCVACLVSGEAAIAELRSEVSGSEMPCADAPVATSAAVMASMLSDFMACSPCHHPTQQRAQPGFNFAIATAQRRSPCVRRSRDRRRPMDRDDACRR
jgi:hypothetical protein